MSSVNIFTFIVRTWWWWEMVSSGMIFISSFMKIHLLVQKLTGEKTHRQNTQRH